MRSVQIQSTSWLCQLVDDKPRPLGDQRRGPPSASRLTVTAELQPLQTVCCYSPTLNCDVLSPGSACSSTSIRCMMPKEFWMPNMEPLHQVAANTTSQPYPPSGGTNPPPCAASPWTLTSGSEAGGRGGLHPTSISCSSLSSLGVAGSASAARSRSFSSTSRGASSCSIGGPAAGCSSVRETPSDACAWLSDNPLIPILSALLCRSG